VQSAARFATFLARAADSPAAMKRPFQTHPRTAWPSRKARARAVPYPGGQVLLPLLFALACLLAAFATAPKASAQVFSSTPYVAAPDPAVEQLRMKLEALEAEVKRATDRSERLAFDLAQAKRSGEEANAGRKQAEAELAELKQRVEALEIMAGGNPEEAAAARSSAAGPAEGTISLVPSSSASGSASPSGSNADGLASQPVAAQLPQDEEGLLKESKNLLLEGRYPAAEQGYAAFLAKYSKSPNAHEAQYGVAEALLYQENYQDAANAYGKLLGSYPKSSNGPAALVKLARAMRLMDKKAEACKTLALMPKQFPSASAGAKQLAEAERQKANCK
jgi:tol-pal system protein YbgF